MSDDNRTATVLVVDDEHQLVSLVAYALRSAGLDVEEAHDAKAARRIAASQALDLIVLDVVLPDASGYELCGELRAMTSAPVIFLTARGDQADVLTGLRAGGDDYLAKPFSIEELLLRIWAVLRRSRRSDAPISVGPLVINPAIHEATLVGRALDLTPLEFRLLAYLARASERVVPVPELVAEVWGVVDFGAHDPLVKSTVYRLRHKLGDQSDRPGVDLRNVRGVGYQLRPVS